jgi:hypothetical protein
MEGSSIIALGLALVAQHANQVAIQAAQSIPYWEFHLGAGQTVVPILGDTNPRNNFYVGLQYAKSEKHLRIANRSGELFHEVYYEHSGSYSGQGPNGNLPSQYDGLGYLLGARYTWGLKGGYKLYGDLAVGLLYVSERTADLPSRLNSTPVLDFGLIIPNRSNPVTVGFRFLHISNGGAVPPNAGQNQLFLDLGIRF